MTNQTISWSSFLLGGGERERERERDAPKLQLFTSPVPISPYCHLRNDFKCSKHQVGLCTSSPSTVPTQLAMASQIQSPYPNSSPSSVPAQLAMASQIQSPYPKNIFHKNREISILTIKKKTARLTLLQEATERTRQGETQNKTKHEKHTAVWTKVPVSHLFRDHQQ